MSKEGIEICSKSHFSVNVAFNTFVNMPNQSTCSWRNKKENLLAKIFNADFFHFTLGHFTLELSHWLRVVPGGVPG